MAFVWDRSAPWYYGADGQLYQAINPDGEGWAFPNAPVDDDGRHVTRLEGDSPDDQALISRRLGELLGYDPNNRQVNQNGSREVQIFNPASGGYETAVATASGQEMPLSLALARGEQIIQYLKDPEPDSGGLVPQLKDMFIDSGAWLPLAAPFAVNALGGANMFGTAGSAGSGALDAALADGFYSGANAANAGGLNLASAGGTLDAGAAGLNLGGSGMGLQAGVGSGLSGLGELTAGGLGASAATGGATGLATGGVINPLTSLSQLTAGGLGAGLATGGLGLQTALSGLGLGVGAPATLATLNALSGAGGASVGAAAAGGAAAQGAAGSALSRVMNGTASASDYLSLGLPLAGGLLGGMSANSSPAGTTTTVQDIPDWQKPYVMGLLNSAQQTFQNQQGNQQPGLLAGMGGDQMQATIRGDYLSPDSNPWLKDTYDKAARSLTDQYNYSTMPQLSRAFGNQQAFGGSSAYGEAFGKANEGLATGLADLGTGIYGGNYQSERGRQFTAGAGAPDYASSMQTQPYAGLQAYGNIVGKGFGSQTQQPYFTNPTGGAMSGLLGGYALSNMFGK